MYWWIEGSKYSGCGLNINYTHMCMHFLFAYLLCWRYEVLRHTPTNPSLVVNIYIRGNVVFEQYIWAIHTEISLHILKNINFTFLFFFSNLFFCFLFLFFIFITTPTKNRQVQLKLYIKCFVFHHEFNIHANENLRMLYSLEQLLKSHYYTSIIEQFIKLYRILTNKWRNKQTEWKALKWMDVDKFPIHLQCAHIPNWYT